jgi:hypothetical protein
MDKQMNPNTDPYPFCAAGQLRKKRCFPCMCLPQHVEQAYNEGKEQPYIVAKLIGDPSREVQIVTTEMMVEAVREKLQSFLDDKPEYPEDILLQSDLPLLPLELWACLHAFSDDLFIVVRIEAYKPNNGAVFRIMTDLLKD